MDQMTLAKFNEELVSNPTVRNCNLKAELRDGKLAVVGKVKTFYMKQLALHLARKWAPHHTYILTTEIVVE